MIIECDYLNEIPAQTISYLDATSSIQTQIDSISSGTGGSSATAAAGSATAAAGSATDAAGSATAAAKSEIGAGNSAANATNSATAAAGSASAAASSMGVAAGSAAAAGVSAIAAASAATAATASAATATASAATATASATAAAGSATAAAGSATAAAGSATAAAGSATAAAGSATAAATSATAAATSATGAAGSATGAAGSATAAATSATGAGTSATAAATSATGAGTSAGAAGTAAGAAATSAGAAATAAGAAGAAAGVAAAAAAAAVATAAAITFVAGPKGNTGGKGDTGDTGGKGDKGDKGDTGLQGLQGLQGIQGGTGLQGIQGDTGLQGLQGTNGSDILSTTNTFTGINTFSGSIRFPQFNTVAGLDWNTARIVYNSTDLTIASSTNTRVYTGCTTTSYGTERFTILNNGNIGIGTTTPTYKFHLEGDGYVSRLLRFAEYNYGGDGAGIDWNTARIGYDSVDLRLITSNNFRFITGRTTAAYGFERLTILNNGCCGINSSAPDCALDVRPQATTTTTAKIWGGNNGTINVYEDWNPGWGGGLATFDIACASIKMNGYVTRSDGRKKRDIRNVDRGLKEILQLRVVKYKWKDEYCYRNDKDEDFTGFIAQEVEEIMPEMIEHDNDGFKSIKTCEFTPLIIQSIQELHSIIEKQQATIDKLIQMLDKNVDIL